MTDRHAELKKQYKIDAKHHPRPWELWEFDKGFGWTGCDLQEPLWIGDLNYNYRRKPAAPIWPTEQEKVEHLHGWALREIAGGAKPDDYECRHVNWDDGKWGPFIACSDLVITAPKQWQVRRKPPKVVMHQIVPGGPQFPAPLTEAPQLHAIVYRPDPYHEAAAEVKWIGSQQAECLEKGLLHATPTGAVAHAKAMAHAAKGTPV